MDPRGKVACPKLIDRNNRLQQQKRGLFDAIGNLGKLEALNEIGLGNVRKGLSAIAAASNQVRGTTSVVPGNEGNAIGGGIFQAIVSTPFEAVELGANIVLDATGVGRAGLDAVNNVNAPVANRALGAAKDIFQQAKRGNFQLGDIPGVFQDLQNLETLARGIFGGGDVTANEGSLSRFPCQPSPYALDLIQRAPRFKFMYMVDIKFTPAYQEYNGIASGLAFITKSSTRPQVDFEYEEVNMYNYRTDVIKRTLFQPMTMRFIDDNTGTAMRFYELYMKSISPITSLEPRSPAVSGTFEETSMDFKQREAVQFSERLPISETVVPSNSGFPGVTEATEAARQAAISAARGHVNNLTGFFGNESEKAAARNASVEAAQRQAEVGRYAATVGALTPGPKNLLETITLYHIGDYGDSITAFTMYNPKITSLQPDEVNMADNGEGSEFSFEFKYDSLVVTPNQDMKKFGLDKLFGLSGGNAGATYPLLPIGVGENREAGSGTANAPLPIDKAPSAAAPAKTVSDPIVPGSAADLLPGPDVIDAVLTAVPPRPSFDLQRIN